MIINAHVKVGIPNDVYCIKRNGELCDRVDDDGGLFRPYCSLFNTFLESSKGKLIKCPACLSAMIEELRRL